MELYCWQSDTPDYNTRRCFSLTLAKLSYLPRVAARRLLKWSRCFIEADQNGHVVASVHANTRYGWNVNVLSNGRRRHNARLQRRPAIRRTASGWRCLAAQTQRQQPSSGWSVAHDDRSSMGVNHGRGSGRQILGIWHGAPMEIVR